MTVHLIFILGILLYVVYRLYQHFFPSANVNPTGKYVLISGCDSGFGNVLAIELDKQGFNVLAAIHISDNLTKLREQLSPKATVFQLDITKQEDIDAAYVLTKTKTNTLHALVNNAGIGVGGYIDWTSLEVMRRTMDVNFFGHVAMTKTFLPLLITKRNSRVINICSVAGFLGSSNMAAYSASKFALESFSDCLRREMSVWGLRVSIFEPGFMRTPIIQGIFRPFDDFWAKLSDDVRERWGKDFLEELHRKRSKNIFTRHAEDPMKVVRALQHAVGNSNPHIRYRPGYQASLIFFPLSLLPAWLVDLITSKINKLNRLPDGVYKQLTD